MADLPDPSTSASPSHAPESGSRRRSAASFALIALPATEGRPAAYLTQWNLRWRALHLIGGHRHPDESFRDCLAREIGEELGLTLGRDYTIVDEPPTRLVFEAFSDNAWEVTDYDLEVFRVSLLGPEVVARVQENPDNRWVSMAEVLAGRCNDGTHVSPATGRVVTTLAPRLP